jgi:alcohol dehydrogenase (cytochrome c)
MKNRGLILDNFKYQSVLKLTLVGCLTIVSIAFSQQSFSGPSSTASGSEWISPGGTPEGTRYSSLDQINNANVSGLTEKFTIPTGVSGGHQGQPIVVNIGTTLAPVIRLFFMTPSPNVVKAIDPSTGSVLWSYTPSQIELAKGEACCDAVNRGLVYSKGKIVFTTLSGSLYALNASTGAVLWTKTGLASVTTGETITAAPLVVEAAVSGQKDLVIIGAAGAENGTRGWTQALDLNNKGASVWKFYNTGSDVDVGITALSAMPTLPSSFTQDDATFGASVSAKKDLGCTTWGDKASTGSTGCTGNNKWKQGGATVWAWITNDPASRTVYYGTANPGVWNPSMRPGSNKWASSIFARNVDTGKVVWVNQLTPHDGWDYDSMNESILVTDTDNVKKLVHFDKNGFAYKFNALTGALLDAKPFSDVTWAKRNGDGSIAYDATTNMPVPDPAKVPLEGINSPLICPSPLGGKEFAPAAYSEAAGLFFVPGINFCANHLTTRTDYIPATPFVGDTLGFSPDFNTAVAPTSPTASTPYGPMRTLGELIAWNPNGTKAWSIPENNPLWGGVLATKGNLVFYGTLDKHFKVIDSNSGTTLADKALECGVLGNPITFLDINNKQKVAVFTGVGWLPAMFTPDGKKCPGVLHIFELP